ncbi:hypothetical protein M3231_07210 [Neobacillus mesonae]|nr:hypothetical protein [Neobacillus mesonae]
MFLIVFPLFILFLLAYLIYFLTYFIRYKPYKPVEFQLSADAYCVGKHSVIASDIDSIIISGYFNPSIGLQLTKKKKTPLYLRIKFQDQKQEDQIMKEIKEWAALHQVQVKKGTLRY